MGQDMIVEELREWPATKRGDGMDALVVRRIMSGAAAEIERLRIRERELLHWLQQAQLKAENAKQKAIVARDAANHAILYAIDAETAAIRALSAPSEAA